MILADLTEIKSLLEIDQDDTYEDKNLLFFMEYASDWIGEWLNRPGLFYKTRTEIYKGTGTPRLCLRSRPVYYDDTMTVYQDTQANFGSSSGAFASGTQLTYGVDYCLDFDTDVENKSRSGILYRINSLWYKPFSRVTGLLSPFLTTDLGSIKVVYNAGYTVDDMPSGIRFACNLIVSNMRYLFPLGVALSSESYEDRSISILNEKKNYIMGLAIPHLFPYRNWKF